MGDNLDWPGLLAWSTKYHDGTAPSKFGLMSDEDKAFLQKAMEDAFSRIEDMNQVLNDGLRKLESATDFQTLVTALEIIERCVDDPDCARNLEKLNGISPLLDKVFHDNEEVSDRSCSILSMMLANNDSLQLTAVKKYNALTFLLAHPQTLASKKKIKLLADIVRGVEEIEELFLRSSGPASPMKKRAVGAACGRNEVEDANHTSSAALAEDPSGVAFLCQVFDPEFFLVAAGSTSKCKSDSIRAVRERAVTFLRHLLAEKPAQRVAHAEKALQAGLVHAYEELDQVEQISEPSAALAATGQQVSLQYTENLAQLTHIAVKESAVVKAGVQGLLKQRLENLLRSGPAVVADYGIEIEDLKQILATQPARM
ncbi:unnamed protein product [Amoebophrya sp. A120]|nr:unnamed protein product [Amoebophrya sp. A120]|eukprot:GSA120T00005864001.1